MDIRCMFIFVICLILAGCVHVPKNTGKPGKPVVPGDAQLENDKDVVSAVSSVAGAMAGKEMTEQEMRKLMKDVQKDEGAQSAIRAITGQSSSPVLYRYCPVDGKHFSAQVLRCPAHGSELVPVIE